MGPALKQFHNLYFNFFSLPLLFVVAAAIVGPDVYRENDVCALLTANK